MAKGDKITVLVATPSGSERFIITATKAGRWLKQTPRTTRKVGWIDINETTHTGRPTGNRLSFRADAAIALLEESAELAAVRRAKRPKRDPGQLRLSAAETGRQFEALGRVAAAGEER